MKATVGDHSGLVSGLQHFFQDRIPTKARSPKPAYHSKKLMSLPCSGGARVSASASFRLLSDSSSRSLMPWSMSLSCSRVQRRRVWQGCESSGATLCEVDAVWRTVLTLVASLHSAWLCTAGAPRFCSCLRLPAPSWGTSPPPLTAVHDGIPGCPITRPIKSPRKRGRQSTCYVLACLLAGWLACLLADRQYT